MKNFFKKVFLRFLKTPSVCLLIEELSNKKDNFFSKMPCAMLPMMNSLGYRYLMTKTILAIDYGTSVVGLAIFCPRRDPWPMPYGRIIYQNDSRLLGEIVKKIAKESIGIVVLGLPLYKNGGKSPMAKKVEQFGEALKKMIAEKAELCYQNEHLTSFEAEDRMRSSPRYNFKVDPKQIDTLSACIILEEFLMEK